MVEYAKAKLIQLTPEEYRRYIKNNWRSGFDKLIVILGLLNVVATIPQIVEIWASPHARAISIVTWSYYVFFAIAMLIYAFLIKSKPMIISYGANSVVYIVVLVSAIIVKFQ